MYKFDLPPSKLERVPESTLVIVLSAIAAGTSTESSIRQYTDYGAKTLQRSLRTHQYLGLIHKDGDDYYLEKAVQNSKTDKDLSLRIRDALLSAPPFLALLDQIIQGDSIPSAMRKIAALSGHRTDECEFIHVLIKLSEDLGIGNVDGDKLTLSEAYAPSSSTLDSVISEGAAVSEAKARLTISKELGAAVFSYLDETDRHLLTDALILQDSKPSKACEKAGQALEDFLRHVADSKGLAKEASKKNGAMQVGQFLVSQGIIVDKHLKLVNMVGALRNTTAHKKDKKTLQPWKITKLAAASSVACALVIIRAIHSYVFSGGKQSI